MALDDGDGPVHPINNGAAGGGAPVQPINNGPAGGGGGPVKLTRISIGAPGPVIGPPGPGIGPPGPVIGPPGPGIGPPGPGIGPPGIHDLPVIPETPLPTSDGPT